MSNVVNFVFLLINVYQHQNTYKSATVLYKIPLNRVYLLCVMLIQCLFQKSNLIFFLVDSFVHCIFDNKNNRSKEVSIRTFSQCYNVYCVVCPPIYGF